jgi:prevent-host-death family protein
MEALTAHEARNSFGDILIKAQRAPVLITKNDKPVAVLVSIEDYRATEALKMQVLKDRVTRTGADIGSTNLSDSKAFMQDLADGKYD